MSLQWHNRLYLCNNYCFRFIVGLVVAFALQYDKFSELKMLIKDNRDKKI